MKDIGWLDKDEEAQEPLATAKAQEQSANTKKPSVNKQNTNQNTVDRAKNRNNKAPRSQPANFTPFDYNSAAKSENSTADSTKQQNSSSAPFDPYHKVHHQEGKRGGKPTTGHQQQNQQRSTKGNWRQNVQRN
jgi:hypothetical protein